MDAELGSVVVAATAAVATYGLTFAVRRLTVAGGLVVAPDAERVHTRPTPTAGGTALFLGFAVAFLVGGQLGVFRPDFLDSTAPAGVLIAAAIMTGLGLVDDIRPISPPAKVAGQVLAAMVLYFFGVTMTHFKVPFFAGYIVLTSSFQPLLTAVWVVVIANAVNLIDGLDGLAAGVVAIGAGALCIYGLRLIDLGALSANNIGPLLAAACCGACLGFLPHNFHRAKIFMGDTGAMVLGLFMAAATMEIGGQAIVVTSGTTYFFLAPLVVPLVILGVPILDTVFAVVRRALRRTQVTGRDLEHLHYRLMRLGHGHRRAVVLLWVWTLLMSALVLYPTFYPRWNGVLPFALALLAIGLMTVFRPGSRPAEASTGPSSDPATAGPRTASTRESASARRPLAAGAKRFGASSEAGLLEVEPADPASAPGGEEAARRAHRRRFARHHPPMRG